MKAKFRDDLSDEQGTQCGSKVVYIPGKLDKLRLPLELFHLTTTVTLNLHKTQFLKVAVS